MEKLRVGDRVRITRKGYPYPLEVGEVVDFAGNKVGILFGRDDGEISQDPPCGLHFPRSVVKKVILVKNHAVEIGDTVMVSGKPENYPFQNTLGKVLYADPDGIHVTFGNKGDEWYEEALFTPQEIYKVVT